MQLIAPDVAHLPQYAAALQAGWSPNTTRDVSGEQLASIAEDPAAFVAGLASFDAGTIRMADGSEVARLPGLTRWMWQDGFGGAINLRYVPGTTDLPPHVSGHIGYSVVPESRGRGFATRALALILPLAAAAGMPHVIVTCGTANPASQRVIERNGGIFLHETDDALQPGTRKYVFQITL